eukprot:2907817-Pyramimonas_sp.AAC.1
MSWASQDPTGQSGTIGSRRSSGVEVAEQPRRSVLSVRAPGLGSGGSPSCPARGRACPWRGAP